MKIEVTIPFLDGTDRFEAGDIRTVSDERGTLFVAQGWAKDLEGRIASGTATPDSTDLTIHNAKMGTGDNHG